MGATRRTTQNRITPNSGVQKKNTSARRGLIHTEKPMPRISITGARTMGRSPPLMAFCKTVMSVVMRVTSEEDSKRSRLAKEYA